MVRTIARTDFIKPARIDVLTYSSPFLYLRTGGNSREKIPRTSLRQAQGRLDKSLLIDVPRSRGETGNQPVKIGKIRLDFRPKAQVVGNKNKKVRKFLYSIPTKTYVKNPVYKFVDFRIKRAGCSNYGGLLFCLRQKTAKNQHYNLNVFRIVMLNEVKHLGLEQGLRHVDVGDSSLHSE
jgi:hypothetical protein